MARGATVREGDTGNEPRRTRRAEGERREERGERRENENQHRGTEAMEDHREVKEKTDRHRQS